MSASSLAILLGLSYALPHAWGLAQPAVFSAKLRQFPRHEGLGWLLMLAGTAWFLWRVRETNISDFAPYKNFMYIGFAGIGIGTCIYVKDFLAVRGLAVVALLLAAFTLERVRWFDSSWRLVLVTWAYVWVVGGMWFSVSPWRMRDWIEWWTRSELSTRIGCAIRVLLGLVVAVIGATVLRSS